MRQVISESNSEIKSEMRQVQRDQQSQISLIDRKLTDLTMMQQDKNDVASFISSISATPTSQPDRRQMFSIYFVPLTSNFPTFSFSTFPDQTSRTISPKLYHHTPASTFDAAANPLISIGIGFQRTCWV